MAIGYAPTVEDVLGYYGRDETLRALRRAGKGRAVEFYDEPIRFDLFEPPHDASVTARALAERMGRQLRATMRGARPGDVPLRYPGLHGTIEGDLVLDIDMKQSRAAAFDAGRRVIDLLDDLGVPFRVKFSGNCSPHILVPRDAYRPWVMAPDESVAFGRLFSWLQARLKERGVDAPPLDSSFDDPGHHLRLAYSLNERTGLVSVPIRPEDYASFDTEQAEIRNVVVDDSWLDGPVPTTQGARRMVEEALGRAA